MNQVREEMQQARDSLRQTSTPEANPKKKRRKASRKRGSPPTRKSTRATNQVQSYADQFDSNEELDSSDNDEDYSDSDSDSDEETTNKRKANNQFSLKKEKKKSKTNYPPTSRQMSTAANKLIKTCMTISTLHTFKLPTQQKWKFRTSITPKNEINQSSSSK
tara:strand:+ start:263 stop:748 length:486 start_codon:yes stop_codon:yes gene_type:complete